MLNEQEFCNKKFQWRKQHWSKLDSVESAKLNALDRESAGNIEEHRIGIWNGIHMSKSEQGAP